MRIIVIGAEAAGASAAAKAKRLVSDAEVVVYEKSQITSFGACGLPYFVAGCFDDAGVMIARTAEQFRRSGIDMRTGHEVLALDPQAKTLSVRNLEDGKTFSDRYDRLLIATGAAAIVPPIASLDRGNVFLLKTLDDGIAMRNAVQDDAVKNVVIVGGGFIGLEVAEAMKVRGKTVRIFQLEDRVLHQAFDAEITALIEAELRRQDIALHMGESVKALAGTGRVGSVVSDKGEYPADLVAVCVGVRPSTALFRNCGLKTLDNGALIIDDRGRTNLPDIFAAGDCATVNHRGKTAPDYIPLATTANKLGRIIGENLAGGDAVFPGTLGAAAIRVLDVEAGRVGLTEAEAAATGAPVATAFVTDKNISSYVPDHQADVAVKLIYNARSRILLGGQTVGGAGAALRIDALSAAIWAEMTVDHIRMMDFIYAPPFSRPWDVLNIAASAAR